MLPTSRRLQRAQDIITAKNARIRELEASLAAAHRRVQHTGDDGTAADQVVELEALVRRLTATVTQLRAGVVDDVQTAELRRRLAQEQRAVRDLDARLATLQAANSGIPTLRGAAA